jgi:hypothetical protein
MNDLLRFAVRGALGTLIVPVLFFIFLYVVYGVYGGYLFLIMISFPLYALPPGAIVGALLWFLGSRSTHVLKPMMRILVGATVIVQILVLLHTLFFIYFYSRHESSTVIADFVPHRFWFIQCALIGAFAGLACPSKLISSRHGRRPMYQRGLTYRERVLFDEQAEREAKLAREKKDSEDGRLTGTR